MSEIRKDQIAEKGVLDNLIPTKQQLDSVNALNAALKELAKTTQEGLKADGSSVAGMKKQAEAQDKLKIISQEKAKLDKQKIVLSEKLRTSESAEAKEVAKLREEINRKNKTVRDEIKADLDKSNAYKTLVRETRELKNRSKELGAELLALGTKTRNNAKQWDNLQREYRETTAAAKQGDAQLKKLDKTVGDNFRNVGNYRSALGGLTSALGTLGIAVGVGAAVRNIGGIIADFDQAQTDLASISGKTAEELAPLTKQAKELGATTQFSATQITGLQIELAKLGFTTQEITDSTGGIANFAAATGVEIPRAAALAGSALRAFGLDATEIDRVVSTLGVATTKTALDFSQLETGLSTVAPVAKAFGFSIEDTTALLGQLANSGFDASSSATATRNILLNLADANGSLAQELGRPIKSADDLAAGLQELQARGIDLGEALELTDKRSVAAFQTFLDGSDSLVGLRDSITDVNDELTDMADKRLDSVNGQLQLLASAWEGFILDTNEAAGASVIFKNAIGFVAENLTTIIGLITKLVLGYAAYRTALIAINIQQKIANQGIGNMVKGFFSLKRNADGAAVSTSKMGKALKGIGWAAIAALAFEVGRAMWDIASGAARARFESELLAKEQARIGGATTTAIDEVNKVLEDEIKLIQQKRELNQITAEEAKKQQESLLTFAEKGLKARQNLAKKEADNIEQVLNKLNDAVGDGVVREKAQMGSDILNTLGIDIGSSDGINLISELEAKLKALRETEKLLTDEQGRLRDRTADLNHEFTVQQQQSKQVTDSTKEQAKAVKDVRLETEKLFELDASILDDGTEGLNFDPLAGLNASFDQEFKLFELNLRKQDLTQEEFDRQMLEKRREILEKQILLYRQYGIDTTDLELELARTQLTNATKTNDELFNQINQLQQGITAALEAQIDKRIDLYKKEEEAAKSQQDYFKDLAAQGNINAQQSLAKQVEIEREAIREQQRLEKQKQNLQVISSGLQTFNSALSSGKTPGQAFAETILTTQALVQFLSNLSFFEKGTDNAPAGHAIVDEKGAEIITDRMGKIKQIGSDGGARLTKLAAGDKVKTAEETANIMAQLGAMGNFTTMKPKDNAGNSYDLLALGRLEAIERAIKNQPHSTTDWNRIGNGMGEIIERKVKGKDIFINRHRIK